MRIALTLLLVVVLSGCGKPKQRKLTPAEAHALLRYIYEHDDGKPDRSDSPPGPFPE